MSTPSLSFRTAFSDAIQSFKRGGLLLTGMVIVAFAILVATNFIAFLGTFLMGPLWIGFALSALALHDGKTIEFSILFDGFKRFIPAAITGFLAQVIPMIPFILCLMGGAAMAFGSAAFGLEKLGFGLFFIVGLVSFGLCMVGSSLLGLWPYLVADQKAEPLDSLGASFRLARPHIANLFISFILCFLICMVGALFLLIGLFPAVAFVLLIMASLYRQIVPAGLSVPPAIPTVDGALGSDIASEVNPTAVIPPSTPSTSNTAIILGILAIAIIGLSAAGYFGYKAVKKTIASTKAKFEFHSESTTEPSKENSEVGMINAMAKNGFQQMINNINPDLEIKSFDSQTGKFSVLYKPTGEVTTVDMANGQADLEKFIATIQKATEATENNSTTEIKPNASIGSTPSSESSPTTVSENEKAPEWVPFYPDAKVQDQMNQKINGMAVGSLSETSSDDIKKIGEFFESKLKASGLQVEVTKEEEGEKITSINLVAQANEGKKGCNVSIFSDESGQNINLSYTEMP
ncbi:MAG: hypothetical protein V4507_11055 [Verrucomicrobiota bacterium]